MLGLQLVKTPGSTIRVSKRYLRTFSSFTLDPSFKEVTLLHSSRFKTTSLLEKFLETSSNDASVIFFVPFKFRTCKLEAMGASTEISLTRSHRISFSDCKLTHEDRALICDRVGWDSIFKEVR